MVIEDDTFYLDQLISIIKQLYRVDNVVKVDPRFKSC